MRGPGMHAASLLLSGCKCFCTSLQLEFYSLIKIFKTVDIKEKELTVTEGPKNTYKADLENFQTYVPKREGFLSRHLMPEEIKINVLTSLEIQKESGLISKHTEIWHDKKVPVPGFVRPFNGWLTANMFKLLGWGKDVDQSKAAASGGKAASPGGKIATE
mmetsp:Transcript_2352/g.7041  ORF Transcript_2352/g.7041 Transcript_2352/m.7041 type:complete len:160 (+) Transcript_2352:463-942(+)